MVIRRIRVQDKEDYLPVAKSRDQAVSLTTLIPVELIRSECPDFVRYLSFVFRHSASGFILRDIQHGIPESILWSEASCDSVGSLDERDRRQEAGSSAPEKLNHARRRKHRVNASRFPCPGFGRRRSPNPSGR